ncbi:MAG: ABC transporter permease [Candidatus Hatepunaea meridiana]|nr:ABC transporter permease [Candidatus Hatepunaea meridiana]
MSLFKRKTKLSEHTGVERFNLKFLIGGTGFIVLLLIAIFARQLAPRDPIAKFAESQAPSLGKNHLYLKNLSSEPVNIDELRIKIWYRGYKDEANEIILFRNAALQPGEQYNQTFKIRDIGNNGSINVKLTTIAGSDINLAYRFNCRIEDTGNNDGLLSSDLKMESFKNILFIKSGNSACEDYLPRHVFFGDYQGCKIVDHLRGHYILGTDSFERDIISRLIYATQPTILVALCAMIVSLLIGVPIGFLSGYFGGTTDKLLMRVSDTISAFPRFFLIISIVALWGQNILLITIAIGITGWMEPARFINVKVKTLIEQDYILSAVSTGRIWWRIMYHDLLPNILPHILVLAAYGASSAILLESTLSYINFGVREPLPSWGNMLANAFGTGAGSTGLERLWQVLFPGLAISIAVLMFNFLGDGVQKSIGNEDE